MSGGARSLPKTMVGEFRPTAESRWALTELFGAWIRTPMFGFVLGLQHRGIQVREGDFSFNRTRIQEETSRRLLFESQMHLEGRSQRQHATIPAHGTWMFAGLLGLKNWFIPTLKAGSSAGSSATTHRAAWNLLRADNFVDLEWVANDLARRTDVERACGGARCKAADASTALMESSRASWGWNEQKDTKSGNGTAASHCGIGSFRARGRGTEV
ncbi:hypothetical protein DFH06DRAFT_1143173 [Mycena polygramma]|nr:hypothetical protein DFH06DRAFT_1143173 [Mycena polygramma]